MTCLLQVHGSNASTRASRGDAIGAETSAARMSCMLGMGPFSNPASHAAEPRVGAH
jgi:hypothetical protein